MWNETDVVDVEKLTFPAHGAPMGHFEDTITRQREGLYLYRRSEGRICPVCELPISNGAQTCRRCRYEWAAMLRSPRDLAEWICYVAACEPRLRSTVVWQRAEVVKEVR
jgi:ribosomal protein L40E